MQETIKIGKLVFKKINDIHVGKIGKYKVSIQKMDRFLGNDWATGDNYLCFIEDDHLHRIMGDNDSWGKTPNKAFKEMIKNIKKRRKELELCIKGYQKNIAKIDDGLKSLL